MVILSHEYWQRRYGGQPVVGLRLGAGGIPLEIVGVLAPGFELHFPPGAKVKAVVEVQQQSRGLARNLVQCVYDFDIPIYFQHAISCVYGKDRVEKVEVVRVDERGSRIPGSQFEISCDTLLVSVGLIPLNELIEMAGVTDVNQIDIAGLFVCGNSYRVYDLVDWVTRDSIKAGQSGGGVSETCVKRSPV